MEEWNYNETSAFITCSEKLDLSEEILEAIESWARTVGRVQTKKSSRYFCSPNNKFEIWVARLPDPDSNKGISGGFRLVYFFILEESAIYLDLIQRRKDQGGRQESRGARQKIEKYLKELKKYLLKSLET